RAEHELRGPLMAVALGIEATAWMDPRLAGLVAEVERARAGLADLEAARRGRLRRPDAETVRLDRVVWRAVTGWDLTARRTGGGGVVFCCPCAKVLRDRWPRRGCEARSEQCARSSGHSFRSSPRAAPFPRALASAPRTRRAAWRSFASRHGSCHPARSGARR